MGHWRDNPQLIVSPRWLSVSEFCSRLQSLWRSLPRHFSFCCLSCLIVCSLFSPPDTQSLPELHTPNYILLLYPCLCLLILKSLETLISCLESKVLLVILQRIHSSSGVFLTYILRPRKQKKHIYTHCTENLEDWSLLTESFWILKECFWIFIFWRVISLPTVSVYISVSRGGTQAVSKCTSSGIGITLTLLWRWISYGKVYMQLCFFWANFFYFLLQSFTFHILISDFYKDEDKKRQLSTAYYRPLTISQLPLNGAHQLILHWFPLSEV